MAEQFDLPRIMRMRNIFGVPEEEQVGAPKPMMDKVPVKEKKPGAFDQFMASINEMPERQNYKPSNWRKVGAGLVGGFRGGAEGAAFREAPFSNAVGDWKLKNDALATAASQERLAESSTSSAYARDRANDIRFQDLERKTNEGQQRISIAETNAETARKRAEIYAELANGGKMEKNTETGQTFLLTKTGQVKEIPVGTITTQEENDIETRGMLKRIAAQGANAANVAGINQAGANARNAATIAGANQRNAATNATRLATDNTSATEQSETQKKQGRINRAEQYILANPDAADWIEFNENGPRIVVPNRSWGPDDTSKDAEIIGRIRKAIDPDYGAPLGNIPGPSSGSVNVPIPPTNTTPRPTPARPATAATPKATAPAAPTKQAGRVIVEDQNGKRFSLPANQLQQALDTGKYIEVE